MTRDLCTEPQTPRRMYENIGDGLEQLGLQADAMGEQQSKWTQSGSSSRGRCNLGAAAEVDANREQQLKRIDAIGE